MKKNLFMLAAICITYNASQLTAQTLPDYLPADGLVGWWPFNGNANDESGNGNHGTVNGATLAEDRFGASENCFNFSGGNTITIPHSTSFEFEGDMSFSLWVRTATNNNVATWLMKYTANMIGFSASLSTSSQANATLARWDIGNGLTNQYGFQYSSLTGTSVTDNSWHHIVGTFTNNTQRIYVDGVLIGSIANNQNGVGSNTLNLTIGKDPSFGNNRNFNGQLDDLSIYNRALTHWEISSLFTNTFVDSSSYLFSTTVPAFINYQAVARNPNGDAIADAAVQVRFSLLADSLSGSVEYVESHSLTTNSLGLFTTAFGAGTPEVSSFDSIAWNNSNKFLRVELNTGNGYVDMGTQQLLSVPFALRAQSAASIRNENLPVFNDNASAIAAGLVPGTMYRTGSGVLMVVY